MAGHFLIHFIFSVLYIYIYVIIFTIYYSSFGKKQSKQLSLQSAFRSKGPRSYIPKVLDKLTLSCFGSGRQVSSWNGTLRTKTPPHCFTGKFDQNKYHILPSKTTSKNKNHDPVIVKGLWLAYLPVLISM